MPNEPEKTKDPEAPKPEAPAPEVEKPETVTVVEEEIDKQDPPKSPVESGLDAVIKRLDKTEADLARLASEREAEREERRKNIESHTDDKKKEDKQNDATKGKQEQAKGKPDPDPKPKPGSKRLKLFRGTRARK